MVAVIGNGLVASSAVAQSARKEMGFADYHICPPGTIDIPVILRTSPVADSSQQSINTEADQMQLADDSEVEFSGNARIVQGRRGVFADQITYNQETYTAEAQGNVKFYTSNGDEISAETIELEVDTFIGTAHNAKLKLVDPSPFFSERRHVGFEEDYSMLAPFRNGVEVTPGTEDELSDETGSITYVRARAAATSIDFEGKDYQVLHDVVFTNCVEGNRDVELVAKQIELDHIRGTGRGKSMLVKFKRVPIFYFPIVSFPITDERKSGFLFPGYGYDKESGLMFELPYYINIAPQFDATVTPRVFQNRGIQLYGEYRYLTKSSSGRIRGEFLPSDDIFDEQDRYASSIDHQTRFGEDWELDVDLSDVSDSRYLYDFSSDVGISGTTYIQQTADLRYYGENIDFDVKTSAYERVNDNVRVSGQPYERLPEARLDLKEMELGAFRFKIDSEYTNYVHDDPTRVDGSRLRIEPFVSLPITRIYGYLKPELSVQSISYNLENHSTEDDSPSVAVPIFSIDSELIFERPIGRSDNRYLQTLEPRLFYVNIPERIEQEAFPDFDTGDGSSSSFSHFFRKNRFFGGDRVGDTHQISLGLTSRILNDETGSERFRISLGQVFFLDDREVGLTADSPAETESRSDFLAEASLSFNTDWSARSFARWSADENELEYISVSADYFHSARRNMSVAYSRTTDSSEHLDFDFDLPVSGRWQVDSNIQYSLEESELRSVAVGVAHDGCCWSIKLEARQYPDGVGDGESNNQYRVVFGLDDLGAISTFQ